MLHEPRQLLAAGEWLPSGLAKSFFGVLDELIRHVCDAMTLDVARISLHGTATRATSCGVTAPCLSTSTIAAPAPPSRISG
jgi:hypothetical protein